MCSVIVRSSQEESGATAYMEENSKQILGGWVGGRIKSGVVVVHNLIFGERVPFGDKITSEKIPFGSHAFGTKKEKTLFLHVRAKKLKISICGFCNCYLQVCTFKEENYTYGTVQKYALGSPNLPKPALSQKVWSRTVLNWYSWKRTQAVGILRHFFPTASLTLSFWWQADLRVWRSVRSNPYAVHREHFFNQTCLFFFRYYYATWYNSFSPMVASWILKAS